jgi:uncharacterized Zn finger protein
MGWFGGYPPYVSVAERRKRATRKMTELKKKGQVVEPVIVEGRTLAKTFWGKAWCAHLESYSDYDNRLPRGRTYVRNGSVIDLKVDRGEIKALVSGSSIYKVKISIAAIVGSKWKNIAKECAGKIDSLIELLQGKFSKGIMEIITHNKKGLFPNPKEITLNCSCPDWADMCKHVAAVLYGIGARLDTHPEQLFLLRQVDHSELIAEASKTSLIKRSKGKSQELRDSDLSALFGIDIEGVPKMLTNKKKLTAKKAVVSKKKPPIRKFSKEHILTKSEIKSNEKTKSIKIKSKK